MDINVVDDVTLKNLLWCFQLSKIDSWEHHKGGPGKDDNNHVMRVVPSSATEEKWPTKWDTHAVNTSAKCMITAKGSNNTHTEKKWMNLPVSARYLARHRMMDRRWR